jgi:EAL domain-containing protein (putative c-di-GMP-specific phosphodiesterase class I)|tara:strand:- start:2541 stop:3917 length:1377 start_codon:yes stop_codon:yes gene_type:complete
MDSSASPYIISPPTDQPIIVSTQTNTAFKLLDQILDLEEIHTLLQPIYNLPSGEILGYEALTRGPEGSGLESPLHLFKVAEKHGKLSELELLCRKKSIQRFAELQLPGRLFINVSPNTLLDPEHPHGETVRLLENVGLQLDRVVIEITEGQVVDDEILLQQTINHYRQLGFNIAIDDLGSGYSGLKQWSELCPDIVKIDRYFIDGCHQNPIKKEFLKSIVALARATQTLIVAEGVEQPQELQLICELGIDMVQGFLLAKPQFHPATDSVADKISQHISCSHLSETISIDDVSVRALVEWTGNDHAIGALATAQMSLTSDCRCEQARMIFSCDCHLNSLAVLDNKGKPLGLLQREQLTEVFSSRYGDALYARRSVMKVMNLQPLIVDASDLIDQVSQLITDSDFDMRSHVIVTYYGRYLGLVSIRQLLKKITEDKMNYARHRLMGPRNNAVNVNSRLPT